MKKRKIHRPGVPKLTAQNEQGEDEGIGVNAPVPFVFPRNEPKRVKILATWGFSHVLFFFKLCNAVLDDAFDLADGLFHGGCLRFPCVFSFRCLYIRSKTHIYQGHLST